MKAKSWRSPAKNPEVVQCLEVSDWSRSWTVKNLSAFLLKGTREADAHCSCRSPMAAAYASDEAAMEARVLSFDEVLRGFRREGMWLIVFLFVAGSLILGFGLLAEEVMEGDTSGFDRAVLLAFRSAGDPANLIGPPWLEEMGRDVTALGSFAFLSFVSVTAVERPP